MFQGSSETPLFIDLTKWSLLILTCVFRTQFPFKTDASVKLSQDEHIKNDEHKLTYDRKDDNETEYQTMP